jgi:hypothetical protein
VRLAVEAHPNARLERIELSGSTLRVWVRSRPAEGRANAAIEHVWRRRLAFDVIKYRSSLGQQPGTSSLTSTLRTSKPYEPV